MSERLENEVTLICIDCLDSKRAINAMELCLKQAPFKNVKFLTSLETDYQYAVKIPHIGSIQEYSRFCIQELHKYFDTSHVLIVQHDGWILNPECWNDAWLEYDYIGCQTGNWGEQGDNGKGGNGGFSLRSKKLSVLTEKICINYHAEDTAISMSSGRCNGYRSELEGAGCKIATNNVMFKFGCEIFGGINELREKNTFGQHRCPTSYHPQYSEWFGTKIDKKIKSATYGSETKFVDVIDYILGMKDIIVCNETFCQDPHFGAVKKLKIEFEDGSVIEEKEGGSVLNKMPPRETNVILICRYHDVKQSERKIKSLSKIISLHADYLLNNNVSGKVFLICDNVDNSIFENIKKVLPENVSFIRTYSKLFRKEGMHSGHYSFYRTSLDIAKNECDSGKENIIFFCEDDYEYTEDAVVKAVSKIKSNPKDFVSLYDHPDRYSLRVEQESGKSYKLQIGYDKVFNHHWRTSISTCHSFVCSWQSIRDIISNHQEIIENQYLDHVMWIKIWETGKHKLWTPIPGLAIHFGGPHFPLK